MMRDPETIDKQHVCTGMRLALRNCAGILPLS